MAQGHVRFGILGPCEMRVGDAVVPLGTPKQRAFLAMLVIRRNRAVGIDELLTAVWDDSPPSGARATLHTYVFNLRRLMAAPGIDTRAILASAPPGYRLSVPDSDFDLGRFISMRSSGMHAVADGRFEQASQYFSAALAQWRGPVLDDLRDFTSFDTFATALAEDKLETHIALAEAEIACGRFQSVIPEMEALTAEHPYREPLWAHLITADYLAERQSDARDAYQRLKTALAEELGIDPGPTLRALHMQILRQEPLDTGRAARLHADDTINALEDHLAATVTELTNGPVLRDAAGCTHPLLGMSTRIGRWPDNHIVVADGKASRHHAAIIDTGSNFVIADLQSTNGVFVRGRRIHTSATLFSGDVIRIGNQQFTFEAASGDPKAGGGAAEPEQTGRHSEALPTGLD